MTQLGLPWHKNRFVQRFPNSACLIAASFGEGFCLPLIEAAKHDLPMIARDIPVFREVAGQSAQLKDVAYYAQAL